MKAVIFGMELKNLVQDTFTDVMESYVINHMEAQLGDDVQCIEAIYEHVYGNVCEGIIKADAISGRLRRCEGGFGVCKNAFCLVLNYICWVRVVCSYRNGDDDIVIEDTMNGSEIAWRLYNLLREADKWSGQLEVVGSDTSEEDDDMW